MEDNLITGRIHSFQSLGTVDGPGIRFVAFLQGCPLRCGCCHNPDTWNFDGGEIYSARQVVDKALRFREYFGKDGGITLSGGEPLVQPEFVTEIFRLCKENNINTCLDTSGCILNSKVEEILNYTDRVLLDVKYTNETLYKTHVGTDLSKVVEFLDCLNKKGVLTTIRQVIIPTLNDNVENVYKLNSLAEKFSCVDKIELLPFKKICQVKYDNLKINFPFKRVDTPTKQSMDELNSLLKINFK